MVEINKEIKNTRLVGIVLFGLGIVVAICAGAKVPEAGSNYPNTLTAFFIGLGVAIFGNFLWHKNEKKIVLAHLDHHRNNETSNPLALLNSIVVQMESLVEQSKTTQGMKLCDQIDIVLDNYINPFVEKRKTFIDILGQYKGAKILLIFAYAERMLNRCWSAASDGHHEEAANVLMESLHNFKEAASLLDE